MSKQMLTIIDLDTRFSEAIICIRDKNCNVCVPQITPHISSITNVSLQQSDRIPSFNLSAVVNDRWQWQIKFSFPSCQCFSLVSKASWTFSIIYFSLLIPSYHRSMGFLSKRQVGSKTDSGGEIIIKQVRYDSCSLTSQKDK